MCVNCTAATVCIRKKHTVGTIYKSSAVWKKQEKSLFFLKNLYIMKKVHSFIYIVYYSRRKDENTK